MGFVSALGSWCADHPDKPVSQQFIWICFFCNNQHRHIVEESLNGSDDLESQFYNRLHSVDSMLILMDSHRKPQYIRRIWCVFELYVAVEEEIPAEVILPTSCQAELMEDLNSKNGLDLIRKSLAELDVEHA